MYRHHFVCEGFSFFVFADLSRCPQFNPSSCCVLGLCTKRYAYKPEKEEVFVHFWKACVNRVLPREVAQAGGNGSDDTRVYRVGSGM